MRHLDAELGKADGKLVAVEAPIAVGVEPRKNVRGVAFARHQPLHAAHADLRALDLLLQPADQLAEAGLHLLLHVRGQLDDILRRLPEVAQLLRVNAAVAIQVQAAGANNRP